MFRKVKKMEKMRSVQCDGCGDTWMYPWMPLKLSLESIYCDGWRESDFHGILCPDCIDNEYRELASAIGASHLTVLSEVEKEEITVFKRA